MAELEIWPGSGPPSHGTPPALPAGPVRYWRVGEVVMDVDGLVWRCTSPGTSASEWEQLSGGSGASSTSTIDANITAAQILDLHANPVTLVAAPGAGKAFLVLGFSLLYTGGTTPYAFPEDNPQPRFLVGNHDEVTGDWSTWESQLAPSFMASTDDMLVHFALSGQTSTVPPNLVENQALVLGNPNNDFLDGDGTIRVFVDYRIIDLA